MIQEDYRAAIDVGTTKVATVIGRERPDGSVEIAGIGVSPCTGLSKGIVRDDEATTQAIKTSVEEASRQASLPIKSAYVGLSGSHIESHNRWDQVQENSSESVITQDAEPNGNPGSRQRGPQRGHPRMYGSRRRPNQTISGPS